MWKNSHPEMLKSFAVFLMTVLLRSYCPNTVLSGVYFKSEELFDDMVKPIVVVVCGGNMASLDLFETWKNLLKA